MTPLENTYFLRTEYSSSMSYPGLLTKVRGLRVYEGVFFLNCMHGTSGIVGLPCCSPRREVKGGSGIAAASPVCTSPCAADEDVMRAVSVLRYSRVGHAWDRDALSPLDIRSFRGLRPSEGRLMYPGATHRSGQLVGWWAVRSPARVRVFVARCRATRMGCGGLWFPSLWVMCEAAHAHGCTSRTSGCGLIYGALLYDVVRPAVLCKAY